MFVIASLFPVLLTKHPVRILICEPAGVKQTQFCFFSFFELGGIYIYIYITLSKWPRGSSCELLGAPGENKITYLHIHKLHLRETGEFWVSIWCSHSVMVRVVTIQYPNIPMKANSKQNAVKLDASKIGSHVMVRVVTKYGK